MSLELIASESTSERVVVRLSCLQDCQLLAEELAKCMEVPMAIALVGTLGAGKTQWTRFFAEACGLVNQDATSPTFMLVHSYATTPRIYHIDAYRIGDEDELLELGIDEMFDEDAVTIIEWSDRFPSVLPKNHLSLTIDLGEEAESRVITRRIVGKRAQSTIARLVGHISIK